MENYNCGGCIQSSCQGYLAISDYLKSLELNYAKLNVINGKIMLG